VNLGGEPERDDSGLPPVDIVVPDDARELERDVQAYRREQRALRRHQRRQRWHAPLTRDGVVLPLLASCLILALIAGTLLTFFTARPGGDTSVAPAQGGASRSPAASSQPSSSATAGAEGDFPRAILSTASFPAQAVITVNDTAVPHGVFSGAVLALIPAGCGCAAVLGELVAQAADANVNLYLVGGGKLASAAAIGALAASPSAEARHVPVAQDARGTLASTYLDASAIAPGRAPTALLVGPGGAVSVARLLPAGFRLTGELHALAAAASAAATAAS
jgi:hypothetical protein